MICLLTGFTFFDVMSGAAMPARGGCLALLPHGVLDICSSGAAIDRSLNIGIPRARLEDLSAGASNLQCLSIGHSLSYATVIFLRLRDGHDASCSFDWSVGNRAAQLASRSCNCWARQLKLCCDSGVHYRIRY
jgi:hypothetical protein